MKLRILLITLIILLADGLSAQENVNPSDLEPIEKVQLTTSETSSYFGSSISFANDGNAVAIGEYGFVNQDNEKTGRVQVYENQSGQWVQKGQDIQGVDDLFNAFGKKIILSSDGNTIAVYDSQISVQLQAGQTLEDIYGELASQYYPYVRVYQFENGSWIQKGSDFLFDSITDYSDLGLSGDGATLAIAIKEGIDLYRLSGDTWNTIGQQIPSSDATFNDEVSLSNSGDYIIVGDPYYSDPNSPEDPSYEGRVTVYQNVGNSWTQLGNGIMGSNYLEYFGNRVDISSDGATIAASTAQTNGEDHIWVYELTNDNWTQKGSSIGQESDAIVSIDLSENADAIAVGENNGARILAYDDEWNQVNTTVSGDGNNDDFGYDVSIAADGDFFAVGAPYVSSTNNNGYVKVFGTNKNEIVRVGDEIYGNAYYDGLGNSVDMSDDGNIIAIGASGRYQSQAYSRVVIYQKTSLGLQQIGSEIPIPTSNESAFGAVVKLSADGNLLAVSDPLLYNSNYGVVYTYQRIGNDWVEYADPIYGEYGSKTGTDLEFSNDGTILAIGSGGNPNGVSGDQYRGYTEVYQFDAVASSWEQLGERITGEATRDYSGSAIGFSGDGRIIAIGAYGNDGETDNGSHGHVRIFEFENGDWNQMGSDLDGDPAFHVNFGSVVELSNDGETVMIGDPTSQSQAGSVELYNWNSSNAQWEFEVRLKTYQGSGPNNSHRFRFGSAIDLSHDGRVLVIGERDWNPPIGSTNNWGKVHVYTKDTQEWSKNELVLEGRMNLQYFGGALSLSANGNTLTVGGSQFGVSISEVPDFAGMVGVYHLNLCSTLENFEVYEPQPILIPDPNFEQALINFNIDSDGIINGQILDSDPIGVSQLNVSNQNISDLTGIESFTDLTNLVANANNLSVINTSSNSLLETLIINDNVISNLDMSSNTNLVNLEASNNLIATINITESTNLEYLNVNNNSLEDIDLSNNQLLTQVFLNENNLTTIDVSMLSSLQNLRVTENSIVELNVSQNANLITLLCNDNNLVSLIVANGNNVGFTNFEAQDNPQLSCIEVDDAAYSNTNWSDAEPQFNFDSQVSFGIDCAPSNDDCFEAQPLSLGDIIAGTTLSATSSSSFPSCQEDTSALIDVWYQFTAPSSGLVTAVASTALNDINVNIAIYSGCNELEPISCDSGTVEVSDLIPGETYYLQLWMYGNQGGRSAENSVQVGDFSLELRDSVLSLEENTINDTLKVYPNPASSIVNIKANVAIDSIVLFDITGKQVLILEGVNQGKTTLNLEDLSKGLYMIQIKNESTIINKKLLIK